MRTIEIYRATQMYYWMPRNIYHVCTVSMWFVIDTAFAKTSFLNFYPFDVYFVFVVNNEINTERLDQAVLDMQIF